MDMTSFQYFLRKYPQLFPGGGTMPGGPAAQLTGQPMGPPTLRGPMPAPVGPALPPSMGPGMGAPGAPAQGTPSIAPTPEQLKDIKKRQLLTMAAGLMQAGAPRVGGGRGFGRTIGDVGAALAQVPPTADLRAQVEQQNAGRIQFDQQQSAYAQQQRDKTALQTVLQSAAPTGNEDAPTVVGNLTRLLPQIMSYGSPQLVSAVSEVVKTLGATRGGGLDNPKPETGINNEAGTPFFGKKDQFILQQAPDGTTRQIWLHTPPVENTAAKTEQSEFMHGTQIQAGFLREGKDALAQVGSAQIAIHAVPKAREGDVAAQMALLEQYIRTFNPGAVVRSGTLEMLVDQLPSVGFKVQSKWNQWIRNQAKLPAEMVNQLGRQLASATTDLTTHLQKVRKRYLAQAQRYGVPELWVPDIPEVDVSDAMGNSGVPQNPRGGVENRLPPRPR